MEPRFWVRRSERGGLCLLRLEGVVDAGSATELARAICQAAREQAAERVEVSFAHCGGDLDLAVPALLRCLREREEAPGVVLTGLTQHQLRVLGYLGFDEAGETRGP
jgi:hypothetical protein